MCFSVSPKKEQRAVNPQRTRQTLLCLEKNWLEMRLATVTNDVQTMTDVCTGRKAQEQRGSVWICIFNMPSFLKPVALNCSSGVTTLQRKKVNIGWELLMIPHMLWQTWKPLFSLSNKLLLVLLYLEEGVFWMEHIAYLIDLPAWAAHELRIRGGHVELKAPRDFTASLLRMMRRPRPLWS